MNRKCAVFCCAVVLLAASVGAGGQVQFGAEKFVGTDTSLFFSTRNQGRLFDDIANSQFWAKLRTLPGILMLRAQLNAQLTGNERYQAFMAQHGEEVEFLKGLLRDEVTVVVPNSCVADLAKLLGAMGEVAITHGQLMGGGADDQPRAALRKQAEQAWRRILAAKTPTAVLLAKTAHPDARAVLKKLFALLQQPPGEEAPVLIEFSSLEHAGVPIEKVRIGLGEQARADFIEGLDLAKALPPDVAQEIGEGLLEEFTKLVEIHYAVSGGYCMISVGGEPKPLLDMIDRQKTAGGDSLASSARFKPLVGWMEGEVDTVLFADATTWGPTYTENISPLLVLVLEALDRFDPAGQALAPVRKMATNFDRLLAAFPQALKYAGSVTVRDQGLLSRGFARIDPQGARNFNQIMRDSRFGHVTVFEMTNKPPRLPKLAPSDTLLVGVDVNADAAAMWASVTRSLEDQRPNLERQPEGQKVLKLFDKYDQFVKERVVPKLGSEMGALMCPGGPLDFTQPPDFLPPLPQWLKTAQDLPLPSVALAFEAKDGPGLMAAMQELVSQINADLAAENVQFAVQFLAPDPYKGVNIQSVLLSFGDGFRPCYAVAGDFFVMASSPVAVRKMIDAAGGGPSLASNPRYKAIGDVFRPEVMRMGFMDLEGGLDQLKELTRFVFKVIDKQIQTPEAGQAQLGAAMLIASIKTTVLQGIDCLKVLKCSGGSSWAEGDMIYSTSRLRVVDLPAPAPGP